MPCISSKQTNVLCAFIVYTFYIKMTLSQIDYDLEDNIYLQTNCQTNQEYPCKAIDNYDAYFSRKPTKFNTRKLNVKDFYLSLYNAYEIRIPLPNEWYRTYKSRYNTIKYTSTEIAIDAVKKSSLIEKNNLKRKIYQNDKSYNITSVDYYDMNMNYIRVVAIKRMIKMMSLSTPNDIEYDVQIIKAIQEQAKPPPPPARTSNPAFMSFIFGSQKSTVESTEKKLTLENFLGNYKQLDYSEGTIVDVLSLQQFNKIQYLMTLLPTKDEDITSYNERFTYLLQFIITLRKNSKQIVQQPIKIDKITNERFQSLRLKYPLKKETYNFYLVRSKVYGFSTFHFKFCQNRLNVFTNENEADLGSLFDIPKDEQHPTD